MNTRRNVEVFSAGRAICYLALTLLATAFLAPPALAQETKAQEKAAPPDVVIEVDGLSCPFCTYGIEKKLKKIDAIKSIDFSLEQGTVAIMLKEGATVAEEALRGAIEEAGFTAKRIAFADPRRVSPSPDTVPDDA